MVTLCSAAHHSNCTVVSDVSASGRLRQSRVSIMIGTTSNACAWSFRPHHFQQRTVLLSSQKLWHSGSAVACSQQQGTALTVEQVLTLPLFSVAGRSCQNRAGLSTSWRWLARKSRTFRLVSCPRAPSIYMRDRSSHFNHQHDHHLLLLFTTLNFV